MTFTGKISYGLYLWHFPLLMLAEKRFPGLSPLIVLAVVYLVATCSWFTVERHFRRLKARLDRPSAKTEGVTA
jgi:peptidoglycan/LPS O-acetylase OafA/YrhL